MAYKLDGKTLPIGSPFSSNGVNYPSNWLQLSTDSEKSAIGISEVADAPSYDQRFYWGVDNPKDLAKLKTIWTKIQKDGANGYLAPYDWYVTRKAEKDTAIPSDIQTYRDAVRTTCATRETEINNCSDVAALKTLIDGTYDSDGKRTAGITNWPDDPADTES